MNQGKKRGESKVVWVVWGIGWSVRVSCSEKLAFELWRKSPTCCSTLSLPPPDTSALYSDKGQAKERKKQTGIIFQIHYVKLHWYFKGKIRGKHFYWVPNTRTLCYTILIKIRRYKCHCSNFEGIQGSPKLNNLPKVLKSNIYEWLLCTRE